MQQYVGLLKNLGNYQGALTTIESLTNVNKIVYKKRLLYS